MILDLAAITRAGAPADARRPALQPKAREAPAEAVQCHREIATQSARVAAVGGEAEAVFRRQGMSEARQPRRREVHARAPCRRAEEGDIAVSALRRVRGRACRT